MAIKYPVPIRQVKGHIHRMIGPWLSEYHDIRDKLNSGGLDMKVWLMLLKLYFEINSES